MLIFSQELPEPSEDCIPYPPGIEESRRVQFRKLFVEHTRIVNLKLQTKKHRVHHHNTSKQQVNNATTLAYRSFQEIPDVPGEKSLNGQNGKAWFMDRLKWLSDQLMDFSEDEVWREKIHREGKKGVFVPNEEGDGTETETETGESRSQPS